MSFVVFPAVDIAGGKCVRLLQGRFGTERVYSDDPVKVAAGFCAAGARWIHVVDLDGARTGDPRNRHLVVETARRTTCAVQAGGGLRTLDDVEQVLGAGARRAVLGTAALEDEAALREACSRYREQIAVSLDVRSGQLSSHGWTVGSGVAVEDAVKGFEAAGVGLFIYTDVTRDGTMSGPNIDGLVRLTSITDVPVIASGGISSLEDLQAVVALEEHGVAGAIVGRALYEGRFTVEDAVSVAGRTSR